MFKAAGCIRGGASSLMFYWMFDGTLSEERVSTTGVNSTCLQILFIYTKNKLIK